MNQSDTIFAPASGSGGAVSIIRVSGPDAFKAVDSLVRFRNGDASSSKGGRIKLGDIESLDEVLVSVFRSPHSYTGEDCAEICCHASGFIVSSIMERLTSLGCRMAEPGEFTRRAFMAGKMDLAQAEAVADLIASESSLSHRIAINQLKGGFSNGLRALRDSLLEITSLVELELDFSEEDVEFADRGKLRSLLVEAHEKVCSLRDSFKLGNAVRRGVPVAIVGDVNAGKSTLLNALVGEERAIVSDVAGTTRDTIEEVMSINGIQFRFIDTAGLRETSDRIEKIGIGRSYQKMSQARIVLGVLDARVPAKKLISSAKDIVSRISYGQTLILLRNKVDIFDAINPEEFPTKDSSYGFFELKYPAFGSYDLSPEDIKERLCHELAKDAPAGDHADGKPAFEVMDISARTGEGLDLLRTALGKAVFDEDWTNGTIVTNERHHEALRAAADSLGAALASLDAGLTGDLLAEDLRSALASLGSIWGECITPDEVLGEIFGRFCIGK